MTVNGKKAEVEESFDKPELQAALMDAIKVFCYAAGHADDNRLETKCRYNGVKMHIVCQEDKTEEEQANEVNRKVATMRERIQELEWALLHLVAAKDIKAGGGSSAKYKKLRKEGWRLARESLTQAGPHVSKQLDSLRADHEMKKTLGVSRR